MYLNKLGYKTIVKTFVEKFFEILYEWAVEYYSL